MAGKLRWGVLGTAGIARGQVIPAIQQSSNGEVAAVASRDPARAKAYAAELGVPRSVASYGALAVDPAIDAIYIPLPNSEHAEWVMKAAEAGKAILCEKPLAMNAAEARKIVDFCAARKVPLMEGFMYRFHPQNVRVLELIKSGAIGTVREVRTHLSVDLMNPPDAKNVRFDPAIGGGALLDMGCYIINIARRLMGAEPESVQGILDMDERFGVDVGAAGLLAFSDDRIGLVSCSFRANGQGAYSVVGSEGTIDVPRAIIPGMGTRAAEGLVIAIDADGHRKEEVFSPTNQYTLMAEAFAAAVLAGKPAPYSPEDAIANMAVMDALVESARTGRKAAVIKH